VGKIGGAANVGKHGPNHMAEIGKLGGNALVSKYGIEHMSKMASINKAKE
jgi:hypothetical protein